MMVTVSLDSPSCEVTLFDPVSVVYQDATRQTKGLYRLKHVGALWSGLAYLSRYNSGWFCHTGDDGCLTIGLLAIGEDPCSTAGLKHHCCLLRAHSNGNATDCTPELHPCHHGATSGAPPFFNDDGPSSKPAWPPSMAQRARVAPAWPPSAVAMPAPPPPAAPPSAATTLETRLRSPSVPAPVTP
jgi:hypothetical protein